MMLPPLSPAIVHAGRLALLIAGALFVGYCLSFDVAVRELGTALVKAVRRGIRRGQLDRRRTAYFRRRRVPLRSTKRDAKRAAHAYAKQLTGRDIAWKKARKLLARYEREGRAREAA